LPGVVQVEAEAGVAQGSRHGCPAR
jgi:hypothetical protein